VTRGPFARRGWRDRLAIALLLVAGLSAPFLPVVPGITVLGLVTGWLVAARRLAGRERLVAVLGLVLAACALALAADGSALWLRADPRAPADLASGFDRIWAELDRQASRAAEELGSPDRSRPAVARARLERLVAASTSPGLTLLLVDPDGEPVVWTGRGLLYEPKGSELPRVGRGWWSDFTSATLVSVRPLQDVARTWRVVAGRSLSTGELPFTPPGRLRFQWAPVGDPGEAPTSALPIRLREGPWIAVRPTGVREVDARLAAGLRRGAWLSIGFAFLVLGGLGLSRDAGEWSWIPLVAGGATALALAGGVSSSGVAIMALGALVAAVGWRSGRRRGGPMRLAVGIVALIALAVAFQVGQERGGPVDLAGELTLGVEATAWRLGILALVVAPFLWVRQGTDGSRSREPWWGIGATLLLVGSGTLLAWPWWSAATALAGLALALVWSHDGGWQARPLGPLVALLLAGLGAAALWEAAYRSTLERRANEVWLPRLEEPDPRAVETTWSEIEDLFRSVDLLSLVPRRVGRDVLHRDLAYALWRRSPLSRRDALTAVVARPLTGDPIVFSYGLPLAPGGRLEREPLRWEGMSIRSWQGRLLAGKGDLIHGGEPWGTVEYWLLPLPGFGSAAASVDDLATGLLRGGPATDEVAEGLPPEVHFGLYDRRGRLLWSPWRDAPRQLAAADAGKPALVETTAGDALVLPRPGPDDTPALFLVRLGPGRGLERIGTQALGSVATALLALVLLPGSWPWLSARLLRRETLRSYSTRLLVVYGALLLVPLGLLELLLFRGFEDRLSEQQRMAGEAALSSAQQILGEFVLSLEPGFGIETALDDALLGWVSRVIHHEINLYWGSSINASSKRELFSAGLLPSRIPGEIHEQLLLGGRELAWRTTRAGEARYLELYSPLRIPGVGAAAPRLVLSLPLLAQQEEIASELADLRRRSVLLTLVLGVVAVLIGTRLARTFTRPLEELVRGTDRIASGADRLEMEPPRDRELAALVEAIDTMAGRIAQARERLLREKQVVDRIVEHIEAGIVSLDDAGRVLMSNRLATRILNIEPGQALRAAASSREGMEAVVEFLDGPTDQLREATAKLQVDGEERDVRLVWVPVPGSGEPSALLVMEDATEVLQAQRLQAWAEMARVIAHEVKNPLTPIRLSTEHMQEVWRRDRERFQPVFERCTENILRHVQELYQIAGEFSTYSSIPVLSRESEDLVATVRALVEGYRAAPSADVEVTFSASAASLAVEIDQRLLRRAIRNLVENAIRACAGQGGGRVDVAVTRVGGDAVVTVRDDGPGVDSDLLPRIFEPYFSTDDRGTGLGLPIARRVVEEHAGSIAARNLERGGLEVTIRIPLS
jgi:signal transduction histidine kinase